MRAITLSFCSVFSRIAVRFSARIARASFRQAVTLALVYTLALPASAALARSDARGNATGGQFFSGGSATFGAIYDYVALLFTNLQGSRKGLPRPSPPSRPPTKAEREARVARLDVSPKGDIELEITQPMNFIAVPRDAQGTVVQGLRADWSSSDQKIVFIDRNGQAVARKIGMAELTATIGTKKAKAKVRVVEGSGKPYGGRKRTSTRAKATSEGRNRQAREAQFINAAWSTDDAPRSQRAASRSSKSSFLNAAPLLRAPYDSEDPLPDDETPSLYSPRNAVGRPPGKTEPGARTRAAATGGTELPGSSNFNFNIPILDLPGRGLNVQLSLAYNSQLWNKSTDASGTTHLTYDVDRGWPGPGFRLGFGQIEDQGSYGYTLTDPDGTRHQLVQTDPNHPFDFDSTDGTFIHFTGARGWGTVTYPDGTTIGYGANGANVTNSSRSYPTGIGDRNGNYFIIDYGNTSCTNNGCNFNYMGPRINIIEDTMMRLIYFNYNASGSDLVSISVPPYASLPVAYGGTDRQDVVRFYYEDIALDTSSDSFTVDASAPPTAHVLRYVYFPGTQNGYRYDYSSYGMIYRATQLRGMSVSTMATDQTGTVTNEGQIAAQTTYDYPTSPAGLSDAPRFTHRTDDWAGKTSAQSTYTFAVDDAQGTSTITAPDGSVSTTETIMHPGYYDDGLVKETRISQGAKVFTKTHIDWEDENGSNRNQRIHQLSTTNEAGQARSVVYSYGSYNNVTVASERDFTRSRIAAHRD
jgi:hypothetical protein